jgi:hypothetical protein
MTSEPQEKDIERNRDTSSPFPLLKSEVGDNQGCIWRTRSLDDSNPPNRAINIMHHRSYHDRENTTVLHSSFDAALLLDKTRISGPLFEKEVKFGSSHSFCEDEVAQGELSGKKHLRQRPGLETLEPNHPGTVRKQPRVAINAELNSKTPGRPRRPSGSTKKSIGSLTPSSALKRRLEPLHHRKSPIRRIVPQNTSVMKHSTLSPKPIFSGHELPTFSSNFSHSPKTLTPKRTGPFGSTSTKKSMSKWYNTGMTATTAVLETTFETDSVDTSSPTTTRFRFTSFPASLPRVNNPRSRQCPDSVCKKMSFYDTNNVCAMNQCKDDDGTHNTSISSLSAEGGHHLPQQSDSRPPAVLELNPLIATTSEAFVSDGYPTHARLFPYEENFGYSDDDDSVDSPIRGNVGRTRLNFNMLSSPESPQCDHKKEKEGT